MSINVTTPIEGVPFLTPEESRRIMALDLACRSLAADSYDNAVIVARAAAFDTFIENGDDPS